MISKVGRVVSRVFHVNKSMVRQYHVSTVMKHSDFDKVVKTTPADREAELVKEIESDIVNNPIILYMKGTKTQPMCGFSRAAVQVLDAYQIPYETRDMVANMEMKEALKKWANWPTIPQLYVRQEFIGGWDIMKQLHEEEELGDILSGVDAEEQL
mmetsp:Transcript_6981/g.10230  ORF Transcript_6981/g.10230 Transcript_6981/m.10230 type:complete len:155 (+) Transcript_6981:39-503(+)